MTTLGTLRWVHLAGYCAISLVVLELMGGGAYLALAPRRSGTSMAIVDPRPRAGPLSVRPIGDDRLLLDAEQIMADLPPLDYLGPNGLRFAAMPSFGRRWFALALRVDRDRAVGIMLRFERCGMTGRGEATRWHFAIPLPAYRAMLARIDMTTKAVALPEPGTVEIDGTPVAFERVRASGITSGIGNFAYQGMAAAIRDGLAPFLPPIAIVSASWDGAARLPLRCPATLK